MMSKQSINTISTMLQSIHIKLPLYNTLMKILQFKSISEINKMQDLEPIYTEKSQKIIVNSVHSTYLSSIYKECAIAKTLQLLGHNVLMLTCGKIFPFCTGMFNVDVPPNKGMCKNCISHGKQLFDSLNLPHKTYLDYIDEKDEEEYMSLALKKGKLFGVDINYHALTSAQRYMKGQKVEYRIYYNKLEDAAATAIVAKNIYEIEKPDKILTSHSCYAEWGSFSDYFRLKNVPVYTWYTGYNPKTLIFNLTNIDKNFNIFLHNRNYKNLTEEEKQTVQTYLQQRKVGIDDTKLYNFKEKTLPSSYDANKKTFTMFPNLAWDVDPTCSGDFFSDTFDWIDTTIKIFTRHPDKQLIIRAHPAEQVYKSIVTTVKHINQTFTVLPKNVIIIDSDNPINSYNLFKYTDVGIVSNGTIGLEMTNQNIPVIVVGNAHYKNKGFTRDVNTLDEYRNAIRNPPKTISYESVRDLYNYYYFIKSFIPFPILKHKNFLTIGYNSNNFKSFLEDYYLEHIANCILFDKPFQEW